MSALETLLAALEVSPEVRPGTARTLAAEVVAEVRTAALIEAAEAVDNPTAARAANQIDGAFMGARSEMAAKLRRIAIAGQRIQHPSDCWCSGDGYTRWDAANSAWETVHCHRHVTTVAEQLLVQPDGAETDCTCGSDDSTHDAGCPTAVRMAAAGQAPASQLGANGCPFCTDSTNPDMRDHVRNVHPGKFLMWASSPRVGAAVPPQPGTPRTERSRWQDLADALNRLGPVGIDLDGTLTDHNTWSVIWDRAAKQWTVAGYENEEATKAGKDTRDADQAPAGESTQLDACARCHTPFDPHDLSFDGHARFTGTPFCRRCIDRCHESTDFAHSCAVCRPPEENTPMTTSTQDRFTAVASPVEYGYAIAIRRDPHEKGHVPLALAQLRTDSEWSPEAADVLLLSSYGFETAPGSGWQPLAGGRYGIRLRRAEGGDAR